MCLCRQTVSCCGSSLFLKTRFGLGYNMTLVAQDRLCSVDTLTQYCPLPFCLLGQLVVAFHTPWWGGCFRFIRTHMPSAELTRAHAGEFVFRLPFEQVPSFPNLFAELEAKVCPADAC